MFNTITINPNEDGTLPTSLQVTDTVGHPFIVSLATPVEESSTQYDSKIAAIQEQMVASIARVTGMNQTITDNTNAITSEQSSQAAFTNQIAELQKQKADFISQFPNN